MEYPGLSKSCQSALNTSVSCQLALYPLAQEWACSIYLFIRLLIDYYSSGGVLDEEGVEALCVDSCLSSLQSARSTIAEACTAQTDEIVLDDIAYPGMY